MPMPFHMKVTIDGTEIVGACDQAGRAGTTLCQALQHRVYLSGGASTGGHSGRRVHGALTITKVMDKTTPLLCQGLSQNSVVEVEFKFYRPDPAGTGTEEHYFTIQLLEGRISEVKHDIPNCQASANADFGHLEYVSFTYSRIIWTCDAAGVEHEDSWSGE